MVSFLASAKSSPLNKKSDVFALLQTLLVQRHRPLYAARLGFCVCPRLLSELAGSLP
ncbi:hypothetical protein SAMN05216593_106149 [Pseudomonas asturiensis]|uniref:Uncharacterized protein n=1 Tax=Pseudomonas asturiensis TaxID=1190415 RepID=A0A1M7NK92_9PSED|nr:hypothetical protein SAMN05216593_106149 [Pseudomonas asturiensis]